MNSTGDAPGPEPVDAAEGPIDHAEAAKIRRVLTRAYEDPGRPPTLWERVLYRVVRGAAVWFARIYWRLEVHGLEHVPEGAFVLSAVHRSNVDSLIVAAVTKRRLRYFGKHQMWKYRPAAKFFGDRYHDAILRQRPPFVTR